MSRYSGRNHFLSDIVAGSVIGFFIGRYVYRDYHDPDIDRPRPKKTTWLHPTVIPYYNGRMHSYGGSLVWSLLTRSLWSTAVPAASLLCHATHRNTRGRGA